MNELIKVKDGALDLAQDVIDNIIDIEKRAKELKELQESYKSKLLEIMENNDILKFETDEITITRKASTTRETLDSKLLRAELPDVYDAYVKISDVKGSVTIKVK